MSQTQEQMGTQFSLHKISYDPEGFTQWSEAKTEKMSKKFQEILETTLGPVNLHVNEEEYQERFLKWAASWDCKENESNN